MCGVASILEVNLLEERVYIFLLECIGDKYNNHLSGIVEYKIEIHICLLCSTG